jgi:hypothetical protein
VTSALLHAVHIPLHRWSTALYLALGGAGAEGTPSEAAKRDRAASASNRGSGSSGSNAGDHVSVRAWMAQLLGVWIRRRVVLGPLLDRDPCRDPMPAAFVASPLRWIPRHCVMLIHAYAAPTFEPIPDTAFA